MKRGVFLLCIVSLLLLPVTSWGQEKSVYLDFKDADIGVVIKAISELTGKNFVLDEKIRGKVTIISPTKIPIDEVYTVLQSILEVKGYTTVPAGEVIKIIPRGEARQKSVETRIGKDIKEISREEKFITQLVPLAYADSEQVRSLLTPFISPGGNMVAYPQTNTIIITDVSSNVRRLVKILSEIDRKPPIRKEMIHVYYLENSSAESLATVLTTMYAKMKARVVGKKVALPVEAKPSIVADKLTNSLIIIATPTQYEELAKIIKKLDIPRRQVLVEAVIAEMSLEKLLNLGVEWATMDEPSEDVRGFGGTQFGGGIVPEFLTGTLYGMSLGLFTEEKENIGLLIRLAQVDSGVNILSTPSLLTNDNQEAEIRVGKRVPLVTATRITEDETIVRTISYEDVGIVLKITPQINPKGFVTLKIHQEIQKVLEETIADAPVLTKREADTTVTVKDKETIVIGGLIRDDKSTVVRKVPFFGNIPFFGRLFRREIESTEKLSLLIFLTPHIVTSPQEIAELTAEKEAEAEKFIEKEIEKK